MTWLQVIVYALVQGITELFPVSSVGHSVILPFIFGWTNISGSNDFLPFIVLLHLGTAAALLIFFWRDWVDLIASLFTNRPKQRRLLGLIIIATIPAAIIGKLFEHKFRALFPSALSAGIFLVVNGLILFAVDRLQKRGQRVRTKKDVSYLEAFLIGCVQVLALIPGFSRSGVTMSASMIAGLDYEASAKFSFMLATPIILGAGVLEVPKMIHSHNMQMLQFGIIGGILAGIVAFLSTWFLMRYFNTHEVRAFRPFAWYCIIVGAVVSIAAGFHL